MDEQNRSSVVVVLKTNSSTKTLLDFKSKLRANAIEFSVNEIIERQTNNNGRIPQGTMKQILLALQEIGVDTDRDHINYLVAKRKKATTVTPSTSPTAISSTTNDNDSNNSNNNTPPPPITDIDATAEEEVGVNTKITNDNSVVIETTEVSTRKRGYDQTEGTTSIVSNKQRRIDCINEITQIFASKQKEKSRCSKSFLDNLIQQKWKEYGLDLSTTVSTETIRSRVKRGTLNVQHRGSRPVLPYTVEKVIATTLVAIGKVKQPLSITESIQFANAMIEGSEYDEKVKEYKIQRQISLENSPSLGFGWWRGFTRRYNDVVVTKKGETTFVENNQMDDIDEIL